MYLIIRIYDANNSLYNEKQSIHGAIANGIDDINKYLCVLTFYLLLSFLVSWNLEARG